MATRVERVVLLCLLIPLSATLLRLCMLDVALSPSGGAVGTMLHFRIHQLFGSVGGALLIYIL
jgi:hypothetical protein